MGKKGSSAGVNPKVEAARQRQEALQEERARKKADDDERKEAAEWSVGANARGARRAEDSEKKAAEKEAKRLEMKKLLEQEEQTASAVKTKQKKNKVMKSDEIKMLEAALKAEEEKRKKKESKESAVKKAATRAARREESEEEEEEDYEKDLPPLHENLNRMQSDYEAASGIDAAISLLTIEGSGSGDRRPEKRMKAAYKEFEARQMPILREELPGLKLSQYKERLFEMWKRSPENPLNQPRAT